MEQESGSDSGQVDPGKQFQAFVVLKTCQVFNLLMLVEAHHNLPGFFVGLFYYMC